TPSLIHFHGNLAERPLVNQLAKRSLKQDGRRRRPTGPEDGGNAGSKESVEQVGFAITNNYPGWLAEDANATRISILQLNPQRLTSRQAVIDPKGLMGP